MTPKEFAERYAGQICRSNYGNPEKLFRICGYDVTASGGASILVEEMGASLGNDAVVEEMIRADQLSGWKYLIHPTRVTTARTIEQIILQDAHEHPMGKGEAFARANMGRVGRMGSESDKIKIVGYSPSMVIVEPLRRYSSDVEKMITLNEANGIVYLVRPTNNTVGIHLGELDLITFDPIPEASPQWLGESEARDIAQRLAGQEIITQDEKKMAVVGSARMISKGRWVILIGCKEEECGSMWNEPRFSNQIEGIIFTSKKFGPARIFGEKPDEIVRLFEQCRKSVPIVRPLSVGLADEACRILVPDATALRLERAARHVLEEENARLRTKNRELTARLESIRGDGRARAVRARADVVVELPPTKCEACSAPVVLRMPESELTRFQKIEVD